MIYIPVIGRRWLKQQTIPSPRQVISELQNTVGATALLLFEFEKTE